MRHFIYIFFVVSVVFLSGCQWLPEVGSVKLSESSVTLIVGGSRQLTATVEPAAAEYEKIEWSSSAPVVASVSNGLIRAYKVGSVQITATSEGVSSSPCSVTVEAQMVTEVHLDKYSMTLTEGESIVLEATVNPSYATDRSLSWSSGNSSVASVVNGTVTANSPGQTNIIVSANDGSGKSATCTVTVTAKVIPVTGVSLSHSSMTMTEGETSQLVATVSPSNATNKNVYWSSNNTSVATVASDGTVTAKSAGSATITCTTSDGSKKATCSISVIKKDEVSYISVPDPNFKEYLLTWGGDKDRDGEISESEALLITRLNLSKWKISSLIGIERMLNLALLDCDDNLLTSIDVSKNILLENLWCVENQINTIDLSNNPLLKTLYCRNNIVTYINITKNTALNTLICNSNKLTSLVVSYNTSLEYLDCRSNRITSLDVSNNKALITLNCGSQEQEITVYYSSGQPIDKWKSNEVNKGVIWKLK